MTLDSRHSHVSKDAGTAPAILEGPFTPYRIPISNRTRKFFSVNIILIPVYSEMVL
jgi:hypothetical protein